MPRTAIMEIRSLDGFSGLDLDVTCPAGEKIQETAAGPACVCRIEGSVITAARDPSSLSVFCMGDNELCPTWRVAREMEWQDEAVTRIAAPSGLRRNYTLDDLQEIEDRRAAGDSEGADAIGRRIQESRREQGLRDIAKG